MEASTKNMKIKNLVLTSLFAAVTAVCAQLVIPLQPVPLSISIFAVFLTGALLEKKYAAAAQIIYILLGAFGFPVFAGFKGGLGIIFGPTGGYIVAYPVMAFLIAFIIERSERKGFLTYLLGMAAALFVCYAMGTAWLAYVLGMNIKGALLAGVIPFIPLDLVKVATSAALATALKRAVIKSNI